MTTKPIAIEVRALSKAFGDRVVLSRVDFELAEGGSAAITGANGSGKTTLLRCLATSLRPDGGRIRWFGRPAAANPRARRLIGVVAHESCLYPHLTLRENLVFAGRMYGVDRPADRAEQLLATAGLQGDAHRLPSRISRGMRQRITVVRSLVHDPPILLLDEPLSGLDAEGTRWLVELLLKLRGRGRTLCFSTHDQHTRWRLADRTLHLQGGRVRELPHGPGLVLADRPTADRAA